jgi:RTX calcium-binding nonapeptide repeat (4 copies)
VIDGTAGKDLILGKNGNNIVNGFAGDDVISEGGGNDVIDGGDGNDLIYAGADNDMVMGGKGSGGKPAHYQNRSCLRTYLLGYRPKTYLKMAKNCSERASDRARNPKTAKKRINLGIKRGSSPINICVSSYEIHSVLS